MTMTPFDATSLTTTVGGIDITIETGKYARQASGAVTITSGNTTVLVTAVTQPLAIDRGFFPAHLQLPGNGVCRRSRTGQLLPS